jgi:Zn-finger nucleic acid-binding protein
MSQYRLICPDCSAVIVTACPEAMVWELCPACRKYRWDLYDAKMADLITDHRDHKRMLSEGHQGN